MSEDTITRDELEDALQIWRAAGDGTFLTQPESAARRIFTIAEAWRQHTPGAPQEPAAAPVPVGADRALPTRDKQPGEHAGTDERESLGRLVHDVRLACERDRAEAEGRDRFVLGTWEERGEFQRELDMAIGEAVAAAERERIRRLAIEYHARIGEHCDLHGTVHYRRDFAGLIGGEEESDG